MGYIRGIAEVKIKQKQMYANTRMSASMCLDGADTPIADDDIREFRLLCEEIVARFRQKAETTPTAITKVSEVKNNSRRAKILVHNTGIQDDNNQEWVSYLDINEENKLMILKKLDPNLFDRFAMR